MHLDVLIQWVWGWAQECKPSKAVSPECLPLEGVLPLGVLGIKSDYSSGSISDLEFTCLGLSFLVFKAERIWICLPYAMLCGLTEMMSEEVFVNHSSLLLHQEDDDDLSELPG